MEISWEPIGKLRGCVRVSPEPISSEELGMQFLIPENIIDMILGVGY